MSIPPQFLNDLRDRLNLSDIVGKRVKLTRAGREFKGCCPFHNEKSPSFTVNDDKQFYHCFGCGAHGDVIGFTMQHDNLSFIDAIESLAAEAGMQVPQSSPAEREKAKEQKNLYSLMDDTAKFFSDQLRAPVNRDALAYVLERGITEQYIESFRIGYAPADSKLLRGYLKEKGYTYQQMKDADVIRESNRGTEPYAFFRERIMFPVADKRGRIVAFGGRILPDHLRPPDRGDYKPAKYMNSADTPIFHKSRILYGESHARQAVSDGQAVIVVEGYVDVVACFQGGFQGAVAPMGTALTDEQILRLWKLIPMDMKVPILCFDGDKAGQRAAFRACENLLPLLKPNHSARFAFLPDGQDPDSLIKEKGREAFEGILNASISLSEFLWNHYVSVSDLTTPEGKAGLEKILNDQVDKISDRTVQQYYKQNFRNKLYETFRPQKNQSNWSGNASKGKWNGKKGGYTPVPQVNLRRPGGANNALYARILLATLINHPSIFDVIEERLGLLRFEHAELDNVRQALLELLSTDQVLDTKAIQGHLNDLGLQTELDSIVSEAVYTHAGFARAGSDDSEVLGGWNEIAERLGARDLGEEIQRVRREFVDDFSEENEKRFLALQSVKNNTKR